MRILTIAAFAGTIISPAVAADLPGSGPIPAFPAATASPYNWTGLYAGAHIGGGWINETQTFLGTNGFPIDPPGTGYNTNRASLLGGLGLGYNYQIGQIVLGAVGDFSFAHAKGTSITNPAAVPGLTLDSFGRTDWYGTLAARAGFAIDNVLLYGKGGVAWSKQAYGGGVTGLAAITYPTFSDTRTGAVVGGGVEWAVMKNISILAEYDHIFFSTKTYTVTDTTNTVTTQYSANPSVNIVKVGVAYHL